MKVKLHEYAVDSCTKCIVMHSMTVIGCNPRCACAMNLHFFCAMNFYFLFAQELYIIIYGSGGYDEGGYIEGVSGCEVIVWLND